MADQAQYYYDELGRLVGVVDGQGDAAVYNYDAVGNLLAIQRFTSGGGGIGLFLIAPGSSIVNKPVEIRGFGFTTPPSSNQVQFNGITAAVVSGSGGSLVVTVPAGATTGPVTVTNANGTAASPSAFTVLVPPIVTGVEPVRVAQGVTTRGTIEGFNLKTASAVQFTQAGLTATIQAGATDDTLPVTMTIAASVPPGTYPFSVTTPAETAQSGTITIEVRPGFPTFNVTSVLTVKMPVIATVPATSAPTGPSASTSAAVSVQMPLNVTVPATSAPTGVSASVSAVNSVEMP
ncbi:MAG TPA: RHS repeat protein [Nitrospira sp.]|nr:RHS repeat protein [Nitrospira sp.]